MGWFAYAELTTFCKPIQWLHYSIPFLLHCHFIFAKRLLDLNKFSFFSIDISLDCAIKIACPTQKLLVCISDTAANTVVFHPNGRIYQNNMRVDLVAFDGSHQNNLIRFVRILFAFLLLFVNHIFCFSAQICKVLAKRHQFHGPRYSAGLFSGWRWTKK